jgi:branched-chain amino acid transport system substrate-binding protein
MRIVKLLLATALAVSASAAFAQTIKIGFITSYSGLNGNLGPYMERAVRLYIKQHEKELPPGVKIELITRDDTGPNPDKAKQLAQELIVRDKVNMLAGVIFTPNAMAIAPLATEAKVPFVIMNAGTAVITTRSPYIARTSFTLWQSSYPLGTWAAKKYKTAYTLVSDFGPGHDAETAFTQAFKAGGGNVVANVRVPLQNATAVMKNFSDLGLGQAGIKLIGPGDITTEEELPNMGDVALGVTTVFHWSAAGDRPANKAFVAAWKKEFGANETPNFLSVGSWDGTALIFDAIKQQKGKLDPDRTMAIFKAHKNANSPRGPISIDPETRDIIQPEYLREVKKVAGQLVNVELETLGTAVKDPWKELQKSAPQKK